MNLDLIVILRSLSDIVLGIDQTHQTLHEKVSIKEVLLGIRLAHSLFFWLMALFLIVGLNELVKALDSNPAESGLLIQEHRLANQTQTLEDIGYVIQSADLGLDLVVL